jgi:NitT/TauT family transport system substrate-binding protein
VKFNVIKVTDFGLSVLGSSMYVSNAFAEQNPETVKKLLRATAKGYRDAMANPKEAANIMAKHMVVAEQSDVLEAQVEATVVSTNAPAGKPIGWQADADWQATLNLLKETGGITDIKPLNAYFSNAYLQ